MRVRLHCLLIAFSCIAITSPAQTWDEWFKQRKTQRKYLVQQIVKLQLYLSYVKKGYEIVNKGLNTIRDWKNGDFNLHKLFFQHLKEVNPVVRNYSRVAEIIMRYLQMQEAVKIYERRFSAAQVMTTAEIQSTGQVFSAVMQEMDSLLEQLETIITDQGAEMKDNERLARIDLLYDQVMDTYRDLYGIGSKVETFINQRIREKRDIETLQSLY